MHTIDTVHKWKVGKHVIVSLPYQRRAIGEIQKVTDKFVHVMYDGHEVIYGIDGEDISFKIGSTFHTSIRIPGKGELREIIISDKRKKLSEIDFYSLTTEQVNDIFREMKRLAVIF
jgi:L-ascorbate metabolism protein UlaG (beta-lactamase superfamily)